MTRKRDADGQEYAGNPPPLELSFPWPAPALWPNAARKQHWHTLRDIARGVRLLAKVETWQARNGWPVPPGHLPVTVIFCPPDRRRRDLDGAFSACKPTLDGLAEALEIDDSMFQPVTLDWGPVCKGGQVRVRVGE